MPHHCQVIAIHWPVAKLDNNPRRAPPLDAQLPIPFPPPSPMPHSTLNSCHTFKKHQILPHYKLHRPRHTAAVFQPRFSTATPLASRHNRKSKIKHREELQRGPKLRKLHLHSFNTPFTAPQGQVNLRKLDPNSTRTFQRTSQSVTQSSVAATGPTGWSARCPNAKASKGPLQQPCNAANSSSSHTPARGYRSGIDEVSQQSFLAPGPLVQVSIGKCMW